MTKTPLRRAQQLETSGGEGAVSGRQAGDLEGLSRIEQADSESVDELRVVRSARSRCFTHRR